MRGSIERRENKPKSRCRRWRLRVSLGKNENGVYKRLSKEFKGTYSEAQKALYLLELEKTSIKSGSVAFSDWCEIWKDKRAKTSSPITQDKDRNIINNLLPHLGNSLLKDITPYQIEEVYTRLMNGQSISGNKLSGTYVQMIATKLHSILDDAVKDGIIANNPADQAKRPKNSTKERVAITYDDMVRLEKSLNPEKPFDCLTLLAMKTGIRRGEALGLNVGDVDLDNEIMYISRSFNDKGQLKETKTINSVRELPLSGSMVADLKIRIERIEKDFKEQRQSLNSKSPRMSENTPLICNAIGERLMPHSATRWWSRKRSSLGLDGCTLHVLRHSYLTEMARRGANVKVLQKLAGHSKVSTTLDIYTHINMDDKRNAVEKFGF